MARGFVLVAFGCLQFFLFFPPFCFSLFFPFCSLELPSTFGCGYDLSWVFWSCHDLLLLRIAAGSSLGLSNVLQDCLRLEPQLPSCRQQLPWPSFLLVRVCGSAECTISDTKEILLMRLLAWLYSRLGYACQRVVDSRTRYTLNRIGPLNTASFWKTLLFKWFRHGKAREAWIKAWSNRNVQLLELLYSAGEAGL